MSITASDVLYAKQSPQKLAKALGKDVTANEVFYMEQDPYKVAAKLGIKPSQVFYAEAGSSAFVNAVDGGGDEPEPEPEKKITVKAPTITLFNKNTSDLVESPVYAENGVVTGTFKKVEGWTDFSSKEDEQNGYYLPFTVELPSGSTSVQMYSSRLQEWRSLDSDLTGVVFLGADATTAKAVTVQLKTNDNVTLTLSVATATFNE